MYTELVSRSNFSFLRGASHPEEYIEAAIALGQKAIALTDLSGVYGLPRAYRKIQDLREENTKLEFKLISGTELVLEGLPPVILLAKTREGYGRMCRMLTDSHAGKEKGKAALGWDQFVGHMSSKGADQIFGLLWPYHHEPSTQSKSHDFTALKLLFGRNLYLILNRFLDGKDSWRTRQALEASRAYGIPLVASNHAHVHSKERRALQDTVAAIREGVTLNDAGSKLHSNAERYLKSEQEMQALFSDLPEALQATQVIAKQCTFSLRELCYRYPSEWIPKGHTAQSYLQELVEKGALERYPKSRRHPAGVPENVRVQLAHELELIQQMVFADYFLTIWEIVTFARSKKILCQGRGSAANSAVCYVLGITSIDPVRMNLLFERFISTERGEPPDIDVDFEHERREEVIQYIYQKYGRHRAAMVSAVVTYRSKLAKREVKKALAMDPDQSFEDMNEPEHKKFLGRKLAERMHGFPRHLSIHSGGFTLSADPMIEIVPVESARMPGRTIIQWDKYDLDTLGLLKVDVLSLGMLTAIRKTLDQVGLTLPTVPAEDLKTYQMMQKADTVGVFQIESRAQMNMLGRLQPRSFYDLVIQIAIVRPGPIVGKMVHPYLKRRRGQEPVLYYHPKLKKILQKTLGVPLFQEQVMKMAIDLAGFTPGEADRLRRAIGAWRSSGEIDKWGLKLSKGLLASGLPKDFVDRVFAQIRGFAEYGFPESHSASFAILAYASSYLKCHYPTEFCCALVNSQPLGFYANHTLVDDAKRHGARVEPIDPNESDWDCKMVYQSHHTRSSKGVRDRFMRLGFRIVKGLSKAEVEKMVDRRQKKRFESLADFMNRSGFRFGGLERLAMGGAFDCFGHDQRHALWEILKMRVWAERQRKESLTTQLGLFAGVSYGASKKFASLSPYEAVQADYQSFHLSLRAHPMEVLRKEFQLKYPLSQQIKREGHGKMVKLAGMVIVRQRPSTAKGTVFATLEDEEGFVDLILHQSTYEKYGRLFKENGFLVTQGVLQRDGFAASVLVKRLQPLWAKITPKSHDFH